MSYCSVRNTRDGPSLIYSVPTANGSDIVETLSPGSEVRINSLGEVTFEGLEDIGEGLAAIFYGVNEIGEEVAVGVMPTDLMRDGEDFHASRFFFPRDHNRDALDELFQALRTPF